jgi:putative ABC transport system ATP-binding protein
MAVNAVLEFQQVTKSYPVGDSIVVGLRPTDLTLDRGEVALIMGPSGAGKSTLLSIAGTLLRPTAGTVLIDGTDITARREADLPAVRRDHIGFIFQQFNLVRSMTAQQNIELVMGLRGVHGNHARTRAVELLRLVNMAGRADHLPKRLSGGEQQRVAIARALANNPVLILADEPTANLDGVHAKSVMGTLVSIAREFGAAVLAVSHDDRIADQAGRVLWLEDGSVREHR